MTETNGAPERIWRVKPWTPDQAKHGLASWPNQEEAGHGATEYIRRDVSDAAVEAAKPKVSRKEIEDAICAEIDGETFASGVNAGGVVDDIVDRILSALE